MNTTYLLCVIGGCLAVVGDVFFKHWAIDPSRRGAFIAGVLTYTTDAFVWAAILRRGMALSVGAVLWSAVALLMSVLAGMVVYAERLSVQQGFGVAFVLAGIVLCK